LSGVTFSCYNINTFYTSNYNFGYCDHTIIIIIIIYSTSNDISLCSWRVIFLDRIRVINLLDVCIFNVNPILYTIQINGIQSRKILENFNLRILRLLFRSRTSRNTRAITLKRTCMPFYYPNMYLRCLWWKKEKRV